MVLPPVLKKWHSVKDMNMLPVIKWIRSGKPAALKNLHVFRRTPRRNPCQDINTHDNTLTDESINEILKMAGRDETVEEGRWALHCVVLYANEFGQPKGQDLSEEVSLNVFC